MTLLAPKRSAAQAAPYVRAGALALLLLALTSMHHAYGAFVFDTPWRLHIIALTLPAALLIVAALLLAYRRRGTAMGSAGTLAAAAIILTFPVAAIGLYEGGYNHVVKNVVYFAFGEQAARVIFPAPLYEMPNDFLFETTGIAQFPLAILTTMAAIGMVRAGRMARG